jgi:altronate hydrolase
MVRKEVLTIRLHPADNLVTAISDLPAGTEIPTEGIIVRQSVPAGHKVATEPVRRGEPLRKYGQIIGFAAENIQTGEVIHTHNVEVKDFAREYAFGADARETEYVSETDRATFQGIVRTDGQVATRNYLGILPTVMCSASVSRKIADHFNDAILANYPNVDGVVALVHSTGCGNPGLGFTFLQRAIAGYARHPNFWGVIIVGLGCEDNQIDSLMTNMSLESGDRLRTLSIQDIGGTNRGIRAGIEMVDEMLPKANNVERTTVSASHLVLGLECGGSDAYSGITANPALGVATDLIVRHGGTAVSSETPEIYGAEHLLTRRAISREVGRKLIDSIKWWEEYTAINGAEINNNPSPGNKAGGLTTILEKSLGAVAKGGSTNLVEVYSFAERITISGFVFMDTTSHDLVSITGKVAGGANIVCFTTGRGTPVGGKPVPVIKLATNTPMYEHLNDDMDLNCGVIMDGHATVEEVGRQIFDLILATASGQQSRSEAHGFGDLEFAPWQVGAML